ncbi:MAG TPA: site-specific integrase [Candidatus Paceibacterota bacterium]|nr:site-specific integrase [Candidatus Paceibacterota bacterium]
MAILEDQHDKDLEFMYKYNEQIKSKLDSIKNNNKILDVNKKHILNFYRFLEAEGKKPARRLAYLQRITPVAEIAKKDLEKIKDRKEVEGIMREIYTRNYADWTIKGIIVAIKYFYRWLRGTDDGIYPEEVRWIKMTREIRNKRETTSNDIILREENEKTIQAATNQRDRAIICYLYYSGIRLKEFVRTRNGDVRFDDEGHYVIVNITHGKKKESTRELILKEPYFLMKSYFELHPLKNVKEAPFWLHSGKDITKEEDSSKLFNYALSGRRVEKLSMELMKKAGVKKRFNPHNYRHSRATYLSTRLSPIVFNKFFGWKGSDMWETYTHLSETVLKNEMRKFYGDKPQEELPETLQCKNCGLNNRGTLDICERCQYPLTKAAINKGVNTRSGKRNMNLLLNKLIETPEFKKAMARMILDEGYLPLLERIAKHEKDLV